MSVCYAASRRSGKVHLMQKLHFFVSSGYGIMVIFTRVQKPALLEFLFFLKCQEKNPILAPFILGNS